MNIRPALPWLLCAALSAPAFALDAAVEALRRPDVLLIDVRTPQEMALGMLPGALAIEYQEIGEAIGRYTDDRDATLVLYCRTGNRSGNAIETLRQMGFRNLVNGGGYEDLKTRLAEQDGPSH